MPAFPLILIAPPEAAGQRLDQYLATQLSEVSHAEVSRARVQQLIENGEVLVNGTAAKASLRLRGNKNEQITAGTHPKYSNGLIGPDPTKPELVVAANAGGGTDNVSVIVVFAD